MALGSQARVGINTRTCLLRRLSQNSTPTPTNSKIPSEDFCRSQAGLVHLERQLFSLVNGIAAAEDVLQTCLSLLSSCDSTRGLFKVFCCCSWADRYNIPVIARLFYKLVCYHQDSNISSSSSSLLLTELETACEELLRVLTHLGIPTSLQLDVVSLLYNLSRLKDLPSLHREAVESYLEEIARAFWPYCMPSAPNLWGSELFCDAQCDVLKACGKGLEDKCPVNTARTFDIINTKLIAGDIPQYSRFRLLEVKELRCSGWELSEEAMYYYKSANSKFLCQAKQSLLDISPAASPKNGVIRRMLDKPDQNKTDTQSVTVVRISESDLRSSCQNITKVRLGNEENDLGENNSATVDDYNGCLSEKSKSLDLGDIVDQDSVEDANVSPQDQSKIQHFPKMVPALLRTDLNKPRRPNKNCFSSSTVSWLRDSNEAMDSIHHPDNPAERSASPCSTDSNGSDDVFANAVDPLAAEVISHRDSRTVPAIYRAGLNKSRLPVKSDSAVPALSPSQPRKLALSDSQQERYEKNLAETSEFSPQELSRDNRNKVVEDRPNVEQHTSGKGIENEVEHMETFVEHKTNLGMSTGQELPVSSAILTELEMVSGEKSSVSLQQNGERPKENWREKTLNRRSGNFKDTELDIVRGSEVDENWRNQKSGSSAECWGVDSRASSCETNWRERSCSVEEPNKDGVHSRRWSSAGVSLVRQDSEDKGKRSSSGGFGHPKQDSPISSGDETSKEDVFEIHLSEEESQGLKWRKLAEIQNDCSCKIFHNREKCVIEIRGDPQLCKVAKKRVYSVIATIDEQFGTLVPLSEEILGQLHTEGCHVLAERLAQCSGADVKLISDTQLFISGYRNYVDLAKTQLTKIKVMLKYTDDPDVVSLDHQDNSEGQTQLIDKLFAALDGRSQVTQGGRSQVTQGSQAPDHSRELGTCEGSLSRQFLLSCARSPVASQRPADLRLDRKEDWVMDIVLTTGRKGAQEAMGPSVVQKKGFGSPRQLAQNKEFF